MAAAMAGVASVAPQVNAVTERPQARLNDLNRLFADRDFMTESSIPCCRDICRDRRCYTLPNDFAAEGRSVADAVYAPRRRDRRDRPRRRTFTAIGP